MIYIDAILVMLSILLTRPPVRAGRSADQLRSGRGQLGMTPKARPIWTSSGGSSGRTARPWRRCGCLAPLFLLAVFAPLLASEPAAGLPRRRPDALSPGSAHCSTPSEPVDFVFNMALVASCPGCSWRRGVQLASGSGAAWPAGGDACWLAAGSTRPIARRPVRGVLLRPRPAPGQHATAPELRRASSSRIPEPARASTRRSPSGRPSRTCPPRLPAARLSRKPTRRPGPSATDGFPHLLGTDDSGRDVLVRHALRHADLADRGLRGRGHLPGHRHRGRGRGRLLRRPGRHAHLAGHRGRACCSPPSS